MFCFIIVQLLLLSILSSSEANDEYEYDEVCSFVGGDAGNCVLLENCQPLLKLIKDRPLLKRNLGILVNLTCEFHLTQPKVCCPLDDEVYMESSELENVNVNPVPELSLPSIQPIVTSVPMHPTTHDPSFRSHRNFGKIPSFQKCSLSLTSYLRKARGGEQTFRGQFPWVAIFGYRNKTSGKIEFRCGGSVITKRHILTAAQCTNLTGYGQPVIVRLAEHDLAKNPDCINAAELGCSLVQDFPIEKIHVHEQFDFNGAKKYLNFENDIAVITLKKEVTFDIYVQPVCLPFVHDYGLISFPKRLDSVVTSYVAGWQSLHSSWNQNESAKESIMELSVFPIKDNSVCKSEYYPLSVIADTQICAGSDLPIDCCGSIGSALMISHRERSMEKYFQVGISSYGPFHCRENPIPGLFTRVSSHLHFILNSLD